MTDPVIQSPSCPRCGYDLRGSVASWTQDGETASCPLDGICSECGLTFAWSHVMKPDQVAPHWSFEHGPTAWHDAGYLRLLKTCFRTVRPRKFWSSMPLGGATSTHRLAMISIVLLLASCLLVTIIELLLEAALASMRRVPSMFIWSPTSPFTRDSTASNPLERAIASIMDRAPHAFRWDHTLGIDLAKMEINWVSTRPVTTLSLMLLPACFILTDTTLRRAKVRTVHIARIWIYGLWLVPILASLPDLGSTMVDALSFAEATAFGTSHLSDLISMPWGSVALRILLIYSVPMLASLWWGIALRHYLKLRRAWILATLLTGVAFLASFTSVTLLAIAAGGSPDDLLYQYDPF